MRALGGRGGDVALGAVFALAGVLAVAWVVKKGAKEDAAASAEREKQKLEKVAKLVSDNYALVFSRKESEETDSLAGRPAVSIIKEIANECGISDNLIRVIPEENRKKREITAQVVLKGVRINDLVNFLVQIRTKYPGICDREARLRLTGKGEDSWDAGLALTYAQ